MRPVRVVAALLVLTLAVAGCASGTTPAAPAPGASWILTKAALVALLKDPTARARLSGARIFEILKGNERPGTDLPVVPTFSFKSVATMRATIDSGQLPKGIRAVIYDDEHWSQTPKNEQLDPDTYYQQAATLAHADGLVFIATPAMDLVNAAGSRAADPATTFVNRNIAGAAAKSADVLDIQAQSLERNTARYGRFVTEASAQARAANPKVTLLAGVSTAPPGTGVDPGMLVSAMLATSGKVSGFWMNVPGPHARPDLAVSALGDNRLTTLTTVFTH